LDSLRKREKLSRAEVIRRAISNYLLEKPKGNRENPGFGLWKDKKINSLTYERKIRKEWDR